MDYALFRLINDLAGHVAWLDRSAVLVAEYLSGFFIVALVWLQGVRPEAPRKSEDRLATGRAVLAASLALALGQILIRLVPRPRPFATHAVLLLIERSADPSFPSDHALAAFAIGTAVTATRPGMGAGLLAAGVILGAARVFVGTHYPGDVLGGAVLGAAVGVLVRKLDPWVKPVVAFASRTSDTLWHWATGHRDVPPDPGSDPGAG